MHLSNADVSLSFFDDLQNSQSALTCLNSPDRKKKVKMESSEIDINYTINKNDFYWEISTFISFLFGESDS